MNYLRLIFFVMLSVDYILKINIRYLCAFMQSSVTFPRAHKFLEENDIPENQKVCGLSYL